MNMFDKLAPYGMKLARMPSLEIWYLPLGITADPLPAIEEPLLVCPSASSGDSASAAILFMATVYYESLS